MAKCTFEEITPTNIEDLKKLAADKLSYKNRQSSVAQLKKFKCRQSIDILWRLMINDKVYAAQHDAFLALQAFGEDVKLPRKKKGHLVKDINKKILKTRNSITGESFTIDDFILAFKEKYPEEYDIYTFEKKGKLKEWLENVLNSLPKS